MVRGVRWQGETTVDNEPVDRTVTEDEISTVPAVHELAAAAAALTGVSWRELQILLVAYSGMRWAEHVALTWEQVDADRRRIRLDRQVVEARNSLIPMFATWACRANSDLVATGVLAAALDIELRQRVP